MVASGCNVAKVVFTGTDESQGTHDAGGDAPIDAAPDAPAGPHLAHVVSASSTANNAVYGSGAKLPITVSFDTEVTVTGTPSLLVNSTPRPVSYTSGSGTKVLTYTYTVVRGERIDRLDYAAANALTLSGGRIFNEVGDADLTLPTPGTAGSLGANKQITINTGTLTLVYTGMLQTFTVPAGITSIDATSSGATGGTSLGEQGGMNISGGKGALATGTFTVNGGDQLTVLIGGGGGNANCGAGGGGGSWLVRGTDLLLVAGGGGGGFSCNALGSQTGGIGAQTSSGGGGLCANGRNPADGGTNGNGGTSFLGGGGGGWLTAGTETVAETPTSAGNKYPGAATARGGGFGGGGGGYASCCGNAGAGGGYSGGASGKDDGCAGGGGGSFANATFTTNPVILGGGAAAGNGSVTISW